MLFYFIITLGIHLQYSYTVLTYNKTTKFTYVTALLLTCLLLTYIKIPKTSLQQTKGLLKTILVNFFVVISKCVAHVSDTSICTP